MFDPAQDVFVFLAIFSRLGTMVMLMPVLGEIAVSPRIRLTLALVLSAVMMPSVADLYPPLPAESLALSGIVLTELVIGVLFGIVARIFFSALQITGTIMAFQTSLGFAQSLDPTQGTQGALLGTFLTVLGVTMVVATDTHFLMLAAMRESYGIFAPGNFPDVGDSSALVLATVAKAFLLAMQLCAPFLVFGLVFYLGMGLLAKLMPQVQVFFIAIPANILLAFVILSILIGVLMTWFLTGFETTLGALAR